MGGPKCSLPVLRNGNVPCCYFLNRPASLRTSPMCISILEKRQCPLPLVFFYLSVNFKIVQCCLSNVRKVSVALSNLRVKGTTIDQVAGSLNLISNIRTSFFQFK